MEVLVAVVVEESRIGVGVGVSLGRGAGTSVAVGCCAGVAKLQAASDTVKAARIAIAQIVLCKSLIVFIIVLLSINPLGKNWCYQFMAQLEEIVGKKWMQTA